MCEIAGLVKTDDDTANQQLLDQNRVELAHRNSSSASQRPQRLPRTLFLASLTAQFGRGHTVNPIVRDIRSFIDEALRTRQAGGPFANSDSFVQRGIGIPELVAFLQEKYPIRIADEELVPDNLDSINSLVGFLERKLAATRD